MSLAANPNLEGLDRQGRPKAEYIGRLTRMTDEGLLQICADTAWLSAFAADHPDSEYHWQAEACLEECARRNRMDIWDAAMIKAREGTR